MLQKIFKTALRKNKKIGQKMKDGSIYAGLSPQTGAELFVMPSDASVKMDFNEAGKHMAQINKDKVFGHQDWRLPGKAELSLLYHNRNKGHLKKTFEGKATGMDDFYMSASQTFCPNGSWVHRFADGEQDIHLLSAKHRVRYVRSDWKPKQ